MANETATTVLDTVAAPAAGSTSGDPKAQPQGNASILDPIPGPVTGAPDGSSQDPTKAATPDGNPAGTDASKTATTGAPEAYQPFQVPQGITLDPTVATEFAATAKELNLSQEAAQKLVDLQSKVSTATMQQSIAEFNKMSESWKQQTAALLGNDADKQLGLAAKAREKFASPELMGVLRDSGLGNHPEIVKFFIAVGKAVSEDNFPEGRHRAGDKTVAEIMYPELKTK